MSIRTIGILTSGGDAPGMNACIRAVVRTGLYHNVNIMGIRRGYEGLLAADYIELRARDVGGIVQRGGTMLQTSRSTEFMTPEGRDKALRNLRRARIDALIVIGGNGSMKGAHELHKLGFPVMGVAASIDNDVYGTTVAIGVDTALNTITDAVDKLRDTASSHERAFIIETMGRKSGYLAVLSGVICGAELVLIPEVDATADQIIETIAEAFARKKTHAIVMVAEGAKYNAEEVSKLLSAPEINISNRVTVLGHVQRGGRPSARDRLLAARFGRGAVEGLLDGKNGMMVALDGNTITFSNLQDVTSRTRDVSMEYYDLARILAQ